jgi:hypothetical protein
MSGGTRQLRQPAHERAADAEDVKVQGVVLSMPANGWLPAEAATTHAGQAGIVRRNQSVILGKPGGMRSSRAGPLHRYTGRPELGGIDAAPALGLRSMPARLTPHINRASHLQSCPTTTVPIC